jgi:hypothetical protein
MIRSSQRLTFGSGGAWIGAILILCAIILLGLLVRSGWTSDQQEQPQYGRTQAAPEPGHLAATPPTDVVRALLGEVNLDRALTDLRRLTGEEPVCTDSGCHTITSRLTGSDGLRWAKEYIHAELVRLGYSVELQDWAGEGYADQNLVASKPGETSREREIYFVAHLDGVNPEGAARSPAADDDASGVVALLELARVLSSHNFENTVVLLFSTGEEQGTLGVENYLDQLSEEELRAIQFVVNVEMLGYDADGDGVMQLWSGDHPPSLAFAEELSGIVSAYGLGLTPHVVTGCT